MRQNIYYTLRIKKNYDIFENFASNELIIHYSTFNQELNSSGKSATVYTSCLEAGGSAPFDLLNSSLTLTISKPAYLTHYTNDDIVG